MSFWFTLPKQVNLGCSQPSYSVMTTQQASPPLFIANDSVSDSRGLWARHDSSPCSDLQHQSCLCPWPPLGSLQQGHSSTSGRQQKAGSSAQDCTLCILNCMLSVPVAWYQSHSGSSDPLPVPPPFQTEQKGDKAQKCSPIHWLLCKNCNCDLLPCLMDYGSLTLIKYCKLLIVTSIFASMGNILPIYSCVWVP